MKKYAKEFRISTAPQRTAKWYAERAGIPSASGLGALFDTLKDGRTPSAKAKAYLKQLAFERKFGVTYERFQNQAMKDGVFFEDFAKMVYERDTGNQLSEAFSYVSPWFVATPDAHVLETTKEIVKEDGSKAMRIGGKKGLLECKIVGDETFMDIMENGIQLDHERQTQSQLMASGLDWVDYIVVNLKTRAYVIIRMHRNNKLIKRIYERLHEPLELPTLQDIGVKTFDDNLLREYLDGAASPEQSTLTELPF